MYEKYVYSLNSKNIQSKNSIIWFSRTWIKFVSRSEINCIDKKKYAIS
jgi:hypothetical protein